MPVTCPAWTCWLLGDVERAEELCREAIELGEREGPVSYSVTIALMIASWVAALAQDAPLAHERCDDGIQRAIAGGYEVGLMMRVVNGWARAALGEIDDGAAEIRHATEQLDTAGNPSLHPFHLALLADTALMASRFEEACGEIDQGLDIIENTGERWIEAELHRLQGRALAGLDPTDPTARRETERAITIADRQGAAVFLQRDSRRPASPLT